MIRFWDIFVRLRASEVPGQFVKISVFGVAFALNHPVVLGPLVHGELIISRIYRPGDNIHFRAVCAFDGDGGNAAWTWRSQGGRRPKICSQNSNCFAAFGRAN